MSHEHELELAAAAIDFELTAVERARLEKASAECPVCARAATAYRRQAILMKALPVVDASPVVRRRVERAAGARPQRSSWTWALLAAALLGLLLTSAIVAGAVRDRQARLVDVSQTPGPTVQPVPSTGPSPDVIALDPPSGELADVGAPLAHDSIAMVVTDNLRIRSAPFVGDLSVRYAPYLQRGDRLFVVDGPVIAQNYEWYQVKAWRPRQPRTTWPVGWVVRAGHDGEVWFRAAAAGCPATPIEIDTLVSIAPLERLACYRDQPIELRAVIAGAAADCTPGRLGCANGPDLLAGPALTAATSSGGDVVDGQALSIDPAANVTSADLAAAGVVRLRGAFDHPDATECRPDPDRAGSGGPLSPVDAVLACRARFVVSHAVIEPFPRVTNVHARTVSDGLRVRSLPEISDRSIKYEPLLALGSRVLVLEGPTLGDGYAWYKVAATVSDRQGFPLTGWVAAAGRDGERWLDVRAASGG